MSRRVQTVLGLLAAAALVAWFLRRADLDNVAASLRDADWRFVALATATTLVTSSVRAVRWRRLLAHLARYPIGELWRCTVMGWAVNVLLPGRVGELVRGVLLARRTGTAAGPVVGSIAIERVFDVAAILMLLAGYLLFAPGVAATADGTATLGVLRGIGMALLAGILAFWVLVVVVSGEPHRRRAGLDWLDRALPARVAGLGRSLLMGMGAFRTVGTAARVMLWSLALWGVQTLTYTWLFAAFGFDLGPADAIPLLALLVVGAAVPTPAGIGSFHAAAQIGLVGLFGIDNDAAVAYAIVSHAVAFLPLAAIGLVLLLRAGLTRASVQRLADARETAGGDAGL